MSIKLKLGHGVDSVRGKKLKCFNKNPYSATDNKHFKGLNMNAYLCLWLATDYKHIFVFIMRDICRNKQNQCLSNIDKSKTRGPFCMENRLGHAHYDDVYIEMYRQMLLRAWPFWGWFPYKQGDVGLNVPNSFPYP